MLATAPGLCGAVNSGNGQTERFAFPQAQADAESHGNAVARGYRVKQGKHRHCGQQLYDAFAWLGKLDAGTRVCRDYLRSAGASM